MSSFPIGEPVDPSPARLAQRVTIVGRYVTLAALDPAVHAEALWESTRGPENDRLWLYLFAGPFPDRASFCDDLEKKAVSEDPLFFTIVDNASERAAG